MDGVALTDLTDDDVAFLVGETGIDRPRIEYLRQGAKLGRTHDFPTEVFYGLGRKSLPLDMDRLLALPVAHLRRPLEAAISENIIPASLQQQLDDIMQRFDRLRLQRAFASVVLHQLVGHLLDQTANRPLQNLTVIGSDLDASPSPKDLGYDKTDSSGLFKILYTTPKDPPAGANSRRIRLQIMNDQGTQIYQTEVLAKSDQAESIDLRIAVPAIDPPSSPAITAIASTVHVTLPPALLPSLEAHNIHTLRDIRTAGGLRNLPGLPISPSDPAIQTLDAHANLDILSSDRALDSTLIAKGYESVAAVASKLPVDNSANSQPFCG